MMNLDSIHPSTDPSIPHFWQFSQSQLYLAVHEKFKELAVDDIRVPKSEAPMDKHDLCSLPQTLPHHHLRPLPGSLNPDAAGRDRFLTVAAMIDAVVDAEVDPIMMLFASTTKCDGFAVLPL
jgi:hypothetical protein